jgi:hypothetical protein
MLLRLNVANDTAALCVEGLEAFAMPIYTVGTLVKSDFPISIEYLMEIIYLNPARWRDRNTHTGKSISIQGFLKSGRRALSAASL